MSESPHIYTLAEMESYGYRLHINTAINFSINFIAAYIVLRHSTKAMSIYKFYILLTIVSAFIMDFHITFVFGPYVMLPAPILCGAGFVSSKLGLFWGNHFQYFLMHITVSCVGWSLVFGCIYQYSTLNANAKFFHHFSGKLFIGFTMLFYGMPCYAVVYTSIDREATIEYIKINFGNSYDLFMQASCHSVIMNAHGKAYYGVLCLQIVIVWAVGFTFGFKIYKKLEAMKETLSITTLKAKKQLLVSLIVQATIPSILLVIPILLMYISIAAGWQNANRISDFALPIMAFHSSANAVSVLLVITPYRRTLIKGFQQIFAFKPKIRPSPMDPSIGLTVT